MADISSCSSLEPSSIQGAYAKIESYIHKTPLITSKSLNAIASHSNPATFLSQSPLSLSVSNETNGAGIYHPQFNLFFKCENRQKIGAFKARGAFHAITHLIETLGLDVLRQRGVTTHSSGNHAQALSLAAYSFGIPSYIVMPTISTPSKIAGTRMYTDNVIFSGSTSTEREAKVEEVIAETDAILVPPYDHPDIILGQGTAALEMESQFQELCPRPDSRFDAVLTPLGGGGLLSGTATWFSHTTTNTTTPLDGSGLPATTSKKTLVFGTEPSFSGANDAQMGLAENPPKRIEHVKSLTIADGLRTPVGQIPWSIISDTHKVQGVYSASEDEIKMALRFMMERAKEFIEPSAVVPLAVVLFCDEFRRFVAQRQAEEQRQGIDKTVRPWDVGIILSGGNTTVEAVARLFSADSHGDASTSTTNGHGDASTSTTNGHGDAITSTTNGQREMGKVGLDGSKEVEDVAG